MFSRSSRGAISFFGFDRSAVEASGGPAPTDGGQDPGPGWFFVLQQHPTEPRFGLDEPQPAGASPPPSSAGGSPSPFEDLSWADVALVHDYIGVAASGTKPKLQGVRGPAAEGWGTNSGDMAAITLQRPVR